MTKSAPGAQPPRDPPEKIAKRDAPGARVPDGQFGGMLLIPRSSQACAPLPHLPHVCNNGSSRESPPAGLSRGRKKSFDQERDSFHEASFRRMIWTFADE
jgi:hypothetical protein